MVLDYASKTMQDQLRTELQACYPRRELSQWEKEGAGYQNGREAGFAEGLRSALLDILELRGIALDPQSRERIETCTDPAELERWRARAKQVDSLAALFG